MILGTISKQKFLARWKMFFEVFKDEQAAQYLIYFYYFFDRFDFLSGFSVTKYKTENTQK